MSEITNQSNEVFEKRKQEVAIFNKKKQRVSDLLDSNRAAIARALPKLVTVDRMIQTALTAMIRTPSLLDCTGHSLISCILTSSQLGLMPDNILGECYLIPFNNTRKGVKECTFIVGYKGLVTLAMRSGQVKSITAQAVYAANQDGGDLFDYDMGLNEKLVHKPSGMIDVLKITHFYTIVRFINGGYVMQVMTRAQVEAVRNESKNYQYAAKKEETIWGKYFTEMGCKTVVRRAMKYVPLSPEMAKAVALDEAADAGKQETSIDFMGDLGQDLAEDITHEVIEGAEKDAKDSKVQLGDEKTAKAEKAAEAAEGLIIKKNVPIQPK